MLKSKVMASQFGPVDARLLEAERTGVLVHEWGWWTGQRSRVQELPPPQVSRPTAGIIRSWWDEYLAANKKCGAMVSVRTINDARERKSSLESRHTTVLAWAYGPRKKIFQAMMMEPFARYGMPTKVSRQTPEYSRWKAEQRANGLSPDADCPIPVSRQYANITTTKFDFLTADLHKLEISRQKIVLEALALLKNPGIIEFLKEEHSG